MPSVIANPILKGNSHVVVACSLAESSPVTEVIQGYFVARVGANPIEPVVANLAEGVMYGVALEVNDCSGKVTVVTSAESVLVRTDGTAPANGEKVLVAVGGLVSATGTYTPNGTIISDLVTGYDKNGVLVQDCVWVSLNALEVTGGAPIAAAAKGAK